MKEMKAKKISVMGGMGSYPLAVKSIEKQPFVSPRVKRQAIPFLRSSEERCDRQGDRWRSGNK